MNNDKSFRAIIIGLFFLLLFVGGVTAGYFFSLRTTPADRGPAGSVSNRPEAGMAMLKLYFPSGGRLKAEERQVPRELSRVSIARVTVEEFLKGPKSGGEVYVPEGTSLLGIYDGEDGILYIDFSGAFKRNFEVDAMSEFLLLGAFYESIMANVYGIADVKILVEGAEVETLGGHVSILKPLGDTVAFTSIKR